MNIEPKPTVELRWHEIATAIFAAKGIKSGYWRLALNLRMGGITAQFSDAVGKPDSLVALPTAMVGIQSIAVFPADGPGPMVFNAAPEGTKTARFSVTTVVSPPAKLGRVRKVASTSPYTGTKVIRKAKPKA